MFWFMQVNFALLRKEWATIKNMAVNPRKELALLARRQSIGRVHLVRFSGNAAIAASFLLMKYA